MKPDNNFLKSLNKSSANFSPQQILAKSINTTFKKKIVYVCSFGTESAIILHMISRINKEFPIIMLNTKFLFRETLEYKDYLLNKLELKNYIEIIPSKKDLNFYDINNDLWKTDPDTCCKIRKVLPLQRQLHKFDAWISGRKAYHEGERKGIKFFEFLNEKFVVNPLANIEQNFVNSYFEKNKLKRHPLFDQGFLSIGCTNCTKKTLDISDPRSGRWSNSLKTECGIHYNLKK